MAESADGFEIGFLAGREKKNARNESENPPRRMETTAGAIIDDLKDALLFK